MRGLWILSLPMDNNPLSISRLTCRCRRKFGTKLARHFSWYQKWSQPSLVDERYQVCWNLIWSQTAPNLTDSKQNCVQLIIFSKIKQFRIYFLFKTLRTFLYFRIYFLIGWLGCWTYNQATLIAAEQTIFRPWQLTH